MTLDYSITLLDHPICLQYQGTSSMSDKKDLDQMKIQGKKFLSSCFARFCYFRFRFFRFAAIFTIPPIYDGSSLKKPPQAPTLVINVQALLARSVEFFLESKSPTLELSKSSDVASSSRSTTMLGRRSSTSVDSVTFLPLFLLLPLLNEDLR